MPDFMSPFIGGATSAHAASPRSPFLLTGAGVALHVFGSLIRF
jgi:hypothetical protein